MQARRIKREDLPLVRDAGWADPSRSPFVDGDNAWVPVRQGEEFDADIPERSRYAGRGYYMAGDVAVVHGDRPSAVEVEEIIAFRRPRGIVWIEALEDVTRTPKTELLWGTAGEVRHKENGYLFIMDPQEVMFSMGNRNEKMRIARLIRSGSGHERVADMFAGIGYFTIPMAGAGAEVHAMEINPVAFRYLERNVAVNRLADRVTTGLGDSRTLLSGTYNRIVMGHFDAVTMLPEALAHAEAGSVLHIHSIGQVEGQIRSAAEGAGFSSTIRVHKVKKYRPHAWHVVQDVTLS
ncbi:class I SAM-dependent methyltransferase [Methanoregula formicica]|uniref:Putative methyltransferase n=1 Tax=Methanoregula formicica (strain DSM 22288 / NBRC 105244 / SMSP) TaxID=593750 RepID=L0HF17_METFS|nr:SAM-dependent methyltransferase [Methanoregula formicica]AGB02386.1 putative methyltransferase [Methanoregula formicica SMSP]